MATPRYAWGIDIGNRALKAIRLSPGPEGMVIDDFDVVEHEQVLSNAGDNRESLITSALANFVQRHDMRGVPVAIGVSGQASFARFIKLPPVEPRKIPEIVKFEAIQQIPFPLDEVEWSYQLFQDPQSPDVEVGIFAMRKELVNQHIKYFTDMGVNVQVVQMNPLAVYNAMYYDQRIKGSTMIIDLGAENTDLIIAEGENIWLRSIPIGGNNFTESLVKSFKLKFPKAEELKRNAATSKYGRQILQAMKPVFNDLVSEIQRSIGFYASTHRESRISRVLALGGTFRLPGLQKYVQQNLQLEVHRIDRLGAGAPSDAKVATVFSENILSAPSAYGLALQAMGQAKINSSLLPMKIRREKLWQEKTKWFGAAAAVFLAAPAVAYLSVYWGKYNLDATRAVEQQNQAVLTQANMLSGQWDEVENSGAPDRTRISNVLSLQQGRDVQPVLINDIVSCLPKPDAALLNTTDVAKLPPRPQRKQVRIDKLSMDYRDDISSFAKMADPEFNAVQIVGGAAPTSAGANASRGSGRGLPPTDPNAPVAAPVEKQRGFLIEAACVTPYQAGASLVLDTFVKNLAARKVGAMTPPPLYSIEKVTVSWTGTYSADAQQGASPMPAVSPAAPFPNMRDMGGRGNPRDRRGRGRPTPPQGPSRTYTPAPVYTPTPFTPAPTATTGPSEQFDPMKDPATAEDMSKDVKVLVRMVVVLDPKPAAAPAANPTVAQSNP
jgi:type IV pilus assembly protein PilM